MAARSACHAREAHFTRDGNSRTPAKASSFSTRSSPSGIDACSSVTSRWNAEATRSISARVWPFRQSVIIDAEACEIAQPEPTKLTSCSTSPSILTNTETRSPHSGLWPEALADASGISRRFRGVRW